MESRYGALRTISTVYNVIGFIVLALTVVGAVIAFVSSGSVVIGYSYNRGFNLVPAIISAVVTLLGGGLTALGLFGISQLISLLVDLEMNIRHMVQVENNVAQHTYDTNRLLREIGSLLAKQRP